MSRHFVRMFFHHSLLVSVAASECLVKESKEVVPPGPRPTLCSSEYFQTTSFQCLCGFMFSGRFSVVTWLVSALQKIMSVSPGGICVQSFFLFPQFSSGTLVFCLTSHCKTKQWEIMTLISIYGHNYTCPLHLNHPSIKGM